MGVDGTDSKCRARLTTLTTFCSRRIVSPLYYFCQKNTFKSRLTVNPSGFPGVAHSLIKMVDEFEVRSLKFEVRSQIKHELQTSNFKLQTPNFKLRTSNHLTA